MDTERTFGTLFIGFVLSTILYGLTSFQAYVYFTRYSKDLLPLRLLSGLLWALDTASTGLLAHAMYVYLVRDFGVSIETVNATTTFCISNTVTAIVIALVQAFYIWRVWTASNRSQTVYVAVMVSVLTFGFGLASAIQLYRNRNLADFVKSTTWVLSLAFASCGTACALYLCSALLYFLPPRKELQGPSRLESVVAYALNRPVLIAAIQIAYLISTIVEPTKLYQLPFLLVLGKVYINVLLATLNYRAVRNDRGVNEEDSQPSAGGTTMSGRTSELRTATRVQQSSAMSLADMPTQYKNDVEVVHMKRDWDLKVDDPISSNEDVHSSGKSSSENRVHP